MRPPHRAVPQTWPLQALSVVRPATHHVLRPLRHADHHAATKLLLSLTKGARGPATQAQDARRGCASPDGQQSKLRAWIDWPRNQLYGYDPSATLNDAATLNDTTRNDATHNDATHDDLATPTTTTRPTLNVNAD